MLSVAQTALAGLAIAHGVAATLPSVHINGAKFFLEDGSQFFIKGVAYQADASSATGEVSSNTTITDPLADETTCARDIPLLSDLNTNTIRVYSIDPTKDHSACMALLDDAGIYVIADLSEPSESINRDDPLWDVTLFQRYKDVVDALANYTNVIGFFAGNEVTNDNKTTGASAYVKAAVRDTKKYISDKGYRTMGVGYAANDDSAILTDLSYYFNCGESADAIDFFGYNIYSWCGESSMTASKYTEHVEFFSNYSVPVFFAEYGCNVPDGAEGRIWEETTALYSDEMTPVINGGIVYMYFEEANDYGLVSIGSDASATTMTNYKALSTVIASVSPSSTSSSAYSPTNVAQTCPSSDAWPVNPDALPPTPDDTLCACMAKAATCVPASGLSTDAYSTMFSYICGTDSSLCSGINGDPETGSYGSYSMCSSEQKLTYALNAYYESVGELTACDFSGNATTQEGTDTESCSSAMAAAAAAETSGTTGSGAVGGYSVGRMFALGDVAIGAYLGVAMLATAGMVML